MFTAAIAQTHETRAAHHYHYYRRPANDDDDTIALYARAQTHALIHTREPRRTMMIARKTNETRARVCRSPRSLRDQRTDGGRIADGGNRDMIGDYRILILIIIYPV